MDREIPKKIKTRREVAITEAPYELLYKYEHERRSHKRTSFSLAKARILADMNTRNTISEAKRIFLYMQLQSIQQLPTSQSKLMLQLRHSMSTISKLDSCSDKSIGSNFINFVVADEEKPVFSLTIAQDNVEELNNYSDNPLLITLYKQEQLPTTDAEEEEASPVLCPLAQGHIDLLQFFCKKRFLAPVRTYLYPVATLNYPIPTCKITWEIYTLLPLLKQLNFCNVVFITFESIYNARPELLDMADDLEAELSFRATFPDQNDEYKKVPICKFPKFAKEIINQQQTGQKWASMTDRSFNSHTSLGVHSNCGINIGQIFKNLLGTAGVDFQFEDINKDGDYALVCNSVHRYVLTDDSSAVLENLFAFNEQEIVVEIYHHNEPHKILLHGVVDLSVLLYPKGMHVTDNSSSLSPTENAYLEIPTNIFYTRCIHRDVNIGPLLTIPEFLQVA